KDNRNSIRKEVLHLIKFVKKTVAIPEEKEQLTVLVLKNLNSLDMSNVILNYIDAQKRKIWDQDLSRKEFL
ncbi:hypothetical protein PNA55_13325, partial [Enterococcus faecium]|nr:hypothetical protein [Enterococcus faecium]